MMVRPRKWKATKTTSILLYEEYDEIYKKAEELAKREFNGSFSQLIAHALKEYIERHYPGNPQIPITGFMPGKMEKDLLFKLEAKLIRNKLKNILGVLKRDPRDDLKREILEVKLPEVLSKAIKIMQKYKSEELKQLIEQTKKYIDELE